MAVLKDKAERGPLLIVLLVPVSSHPCLFRIVLSSFSPKYRLFTLFFIYCSFRPNYSLHWIEHPIIEATIIDYSASTDVTHSDWPYVNV